MINLLMRWIYGFRMNNNVRLATFWAITGLLFVVCLISGGFNQPLMDFQSKLPMSHDSDVRQIARNIDRGFGAMTNAQLSRQQRSQVIQPWFNNVKYVRWILLGVVLVGGSVLLILGIARRNTRLIVVASVIFLIAAIIIGIFWFDWVRKTIRWWFFICLAISTAYIPIAFADELRDLIDRARQRRDVGASEESDETRAGQRQATGATAGVATTGQPTAQQTTTPQVAPNVVATSPPSVNTQQVGRGWRRLLDFITVDLIIEWLLSLRRGRNR